MDGQERSTARSFDRSLDELLFECLERIEEHGDEALEELLAVHPEHARELRERLGALRRAGLLGAREGGELPERLGDFRLLERLGEGGMGVVHRATQISLGREVALKLIRPEQLWFAGARERFQREVETIAALHHPGIVAVHAVGEESGVPFFAMELVRGASVDEVLTSLADRPLASLRGRDLDPTGGGEGWLFAGSWEDACLRVVRQACEALQFAHERGVLHRDIKPSNIMIASGGSSRAQVLDFGLASSARSDKLTRTGSQLGSLRYMAPEQLAGDAARLGPHTDVYGLGITLYEMLTLAPAYEGTQAEVALAIARGAVQPLRKRNPGASWEAETICATATDPDPARRYQSAADMARDLANALERRPIEARRASAALRLARWIERRPAAATALALGTLVLVGGPLVLAWQQHRSSLAVAAERDRALDAYGSAMDAVERMLARFAGHDLTYVPAMEALRQRLLEDAVELLEGIVAGGGEDVSRRGRLDLANAHARQGRLLAQLGRSAEAAETYARGRALLERMAEESPEDDALLERVASVSIDQAHLIARTGELERARALHEALEARLAGRLARGSLPRLEAQAAYNRAVLGECLSKLGDPLALETLGAASSQLDAIARRPGAREVDLGRATRSWRSLGQHFLARDAEHVDERALQALERAVELSRIQLERDDSPTNRQILASNLNNLGGALRRSKEWDGARGAYDEARASLEKLTLENPSTLTFRFELATVLNQLGLLNDYRDEAREADAFYRAAADHLEQLCLIAPAEPHFLHRFAMSQYNVSAMDLRQGELEVAAKAVMRGVEAVRQALELAPEDAAIRQTRIELLSALWAIKRDLGDHLGVAEVAGELVAAEPQSAPVHHRAAIACVAAFKLVRDLEDLDPGEREAALERYAERACDLIQGAYVRGNRYPDVKELRDLEPLHTTASFEKLIAWMETEQGGSE